MFRRFLPLVFALVACVVSAPIQLVERGFGTGSVTVPAGLAFYDPNFADGTLGYSDPATYNCYSGSAASFPPMSKWMNFNTMWSRMKRVALIPIGDTTTEITNIYNSIVSISKAAKVDARVILAVIIDESTGNVRVGCTTSPGGVTNCGLMQSHDPTNKTYDPKNSAASINRMIVDGTQGTATGPGLVQYFNDDPSTGVKTSGNLWNVLRGYNSGRIDPNHLSKGLGATPEYVSNIANFLQGWQGYGNNSQTKHCNFPQY